MSEEIEIHGLKELDDQLLNLAIEGQKNALNSALFWASKPLFDDMKANTPSEPGEDTLKRKNTRMKQIYHYTRRWRSREGEDGNSVTVNVGYRMRGMWYVPSKGLWFLHEREFGSSRKAPLGWMRSAANKNWKTVVDRFQQRLLHRIKKIEERAK